VPVKALFIGDIVGRAGRDAVCEAMPGWRQSLDLDFVVANGENAAGGFGITGDICAQFYEAGIDVITGGNHTWDQQDIIAYIDGDPRLLRPINLAEGAPGRGAGVFEVRGGRRALIINAMGRIFMDPIGDPFAAVRDQLAKVRLGAGVDFILIDMHADATSEKSAMGVFADGKASLVVGSHSHVPTADARILPGGTGYQTDAGMCGDYDSVIGMEKGGPLNRFLGRVKKERFKVAMGEATVCGVYVETDDATGLATRVAPVRHGGHLAPAWPE
jgi:metallophosphoesterase (TIGR00282 family)